MQQHIHNKLMLKRGMQCCPDITDGSHHFRGSADWACRPHGALTMFSPNSSRSTLLMATMYPSDLRSALKTCSTGKLTPVAGSSFTNDGF